DHATGASESANGIPTHIAQEAEETRGSRYFLSEEAEMTLAQRRPAAVDADQLTLTRERWRKLAGKRNKHPQQHELRRPLHRRNRRPQQCMQLAVALIMRQRRLRPLFVAGSG